MLSDVVFKKILWGKTVLNKAFSKQYEPSSPYVVLGTGGSC